MSALLTSKQLFSEYKMSLRVNMPGFFKYMWAFLMHDCTIFLFLKCWIASERRFFSPNEWYFWSNNLQFEYLFTWTTKKHFSPLQRSESVQRQMENMGDTPNLV